MWLVLLLWYSYYCQALLHTASVYLDFVVELPVLSRSPTHFVDIYPDVVIQHDVGTQADMFLACSSPVESPSPVMEQASSISLPEDM